MIRQYNNYSLPRHWQWDCNVSELRQLVGVGVAVTVTVVVMVTILRDAKYCSQ